MTLKILTPTAPNELYEKFFLKFNEIENLKPNEWKVPQIIGYFVKKYNETYNSIFKFKFNTPQPSKCFEMFQIKKLSSLLTSDSSLLKEYIDWIFENKILKTKRRITSISFLTKEEFMNEYKLNVLMAEQPQIKSFNRTTLLPEECKKILQEANINISTYGELAFIHNMNDKSNELIICFDKLKDLIDLTLLNKVV